LTLISSVDLDLITVTPLIFLPFLHCFIFFFNDTTTTEIYTLSLHDALPISCDPRQQEPYDQYHENSHAKHWDYHKTPLIGRQPRSEERFSRNAETDLVCRLLLEKKNTK